MAQTPQQRRANDKYMRQESAKRGKAEAVIKRKEQSLGKSPISPVWIGVLAFLVGGGILLELFRLFF